MSRPALAKLSSERRVLVVVGAGGVGKTTVAAALGLAAAVRGLNVLCLTIDPAKRLLDRLGVDASGAAEQLIDARKFADEGLELKGRLSVSMLDTKRTFDDLVRRHASSKEAAERILANEFYEYVSTQLAGTQAYMAMEKVLSVLEERRYDLVVLDTPPTSDALDFLDAPARLIETLDSAALRWLAEAFERSGRLGLNWMARGVSLVLRGIARLTGRRFLERLSEFVSELNELFGGFKERAERVARAFRGPEFAYLLVATPSSESLDEARFFAERLARTGMRADGLIINRVRVDPGSAPSPEELAAACAAHGLSAAGDFASRVLSAQADEAEAVTIDRRNLAVARSTASELAPERIPFAIEVPAFPASVHDVAALVSVCRQLM
ncbi:MAG TPA: ArsA-related P-loop ATPase [Polyangiaceae bacterium]|nr:ArsA-related P-loop ATPase [Polyangiaceae bacterium]